MGRGVFVPAGGPSGRSAELLGCGAAGEHGRRPRESMTNHTARRNHAMKRDVGVGVTSGLSAFAGLLSVL